jgi:hypothetical protein
MFYLIDEIDPSDTKLINLNEYLMMIKEDIDGNILDKMMTNNESLELILQMLNTHSLDEFQ